MRKALQAKGGDILAISAEPLEHMLGGRKSYPTLPCILASDVDGKSIRGLHLLHEKLGKIGKLIAVPANILVDKSGVVRWAHYANIVMDRPDPKKVLQAVQAL